MPTLSEYTTQVRNILNDPNAQYYTTTNIRLWINQARKRIANEAQCVRRLTPSSGSVDTIGVDSGGSGYTTATVTISAPDAMGSGFVNATATATILAGVITAINVTDPGTGYVNIPTVTIDGDGAGASATAVLTVFLATVAQQEVYSFQAAAAIITEYYPEVSGIAAIQTIAVAWGAMKPVLRWLPWSAFQAYLRSYNYGANNYPAVWSQYAQGGKGDVYLFPIPSVTAQMEWDCYCTPVDLVDDDTLDAIPFPYSDAVAFLACYYAYLNAQRANDAARMNAEYKRFLAEGRQYSEVAMVPDFYVGR